MWQVFVLKDYEEGGALLPAEMGNPSGFWLDVTAYEAASAVVHGELARLV